MTTAVKLKKATAQHIESELSGYSDTLKEIEFMRKNFIHCRENDDENTGGGRSSYISSPTERITTTLTTDRKLTRLEEIAKAIQKVYSDLPDDYKKLIRLRYWTKPQTLSWEGIALEINTSRATAFRMRDHIISSIAEELGWR